MGTPKPPMTLRKLITPGNIPWLAAYVVLLTLTVWKLFDLRSTMIERLGTQQAQADWETWRRASVQPGPVERRLPKSERPPTLVLLEEHFALCLAAAVLFGTLVYVVMMLLIRGALRGDGPTLARESEEDSAGPANKLPPRRG